MLSKDSSHPPVLIIMEKLMHMRGTATQLTNDLFKNKMLKNCKRKKQMPVGPKIRRITLSHFCEVPPTINTIGARDNLCYKDQSHNKD